MTPETTTADLMAILAEAGVQNDHGTLRWVFSPGRLEVASGGGTEQQRIVGLLQQTRYLIENMDRRAASSGDALREDLGLTVDMLDVDRLKSWADKIDIHGADISHWAQASFVVTWMQDFAGRLEQCVRDVGTLRAALLASAATDPRPLHERCECATCKAIRAIANPVGLPPSCLAPCPACMSEHGKADPNCQHCGGTGICPSQKVASAATDWTHEITACGLSRGALHRSVAKLDKRAECEGGHHEWGAVAEGVRCRWCRALVVGPDAAALWKVEASAATETPEQKTDEGS